MELVAEEIDIGSHTPTVLLHEADAAELGAHPLDRVQVDRDGHTSVGIVEVTDELLEPGHMAVTRSLGHITGRVDVTLAPKPQSVGAIRKKLDGVELEYHELDTIVQDVDEGRLNDVELTAFVTGLYGNGLSREETRNLTTSMVDAGQTIDWDHDVVADKHSIGGVAGNRTTPIVVPIVASAGVVIPKTSSRAVTSAAGTADTMEVFCDVAFDLEEIRDIVHETNGCMVWGGAVDLSPVDDKIIRAETPLSLDPPSQIIASVLSKKQAAGTTNVVLDLPYGEGAKVDSLAAARELAEDFNHVGDSIGMDVQCAITRGDEPIGDGVGPVLEARDVLAVLDGGGPPSLRTKATRLAQILLDGCGVDADARSLLESGRARETFDAIVAAQNGDPEVTRADLHPGDHTATVRAGQSGVVTHIDNRAVNELARRAGAPKDHAAGIHLAVHVGDAVETGADLFRIHAEKASKLAEAEAYTDHVEPVRVRGADEALVEQC